MSLDGPLQSLDGDTLSVIENPVTVSHPFHSEKTAGVTDTSRVQGWLKGIHSTSYGKIHTTWSPPASRVLTETLFQLITLNINPNEDFILTRWQLKAVLSLFSSLKLSDFWLCSDSVCFICNRWHLINLLCSSQASRYIHSCINCCFSSQTGEAAGSGVCSWTPGRLSRRCLVSRWVTVSEKNHLMSLAGIRKWKQMCKRSS